jgi:hypothetical protein
MQEGDKHHEQNMGEIFRMENKSLDGVKIDLITMLN